MVQQLAARTADRHISLDDLCLPETCLAWLSCTGRILLPRSGLFRHLAILAGRTRSFVWRRPNDFLRFQQELASDDSIGLRGERCVRRKRARYCQLNFKVEIL
jgi:hypothetical protein